MTRLRLVVVAMLASAALAACGGGSTGTAMSNADYKHQADLACTSFQKDLLAAAAKFDAKKESSVTLTATKVAALFHQTADSLRKVGYPKGRKDDANAFYDGLDKVGDKLTSNPDVLKSNTAPKEFKDLDALAKKIGITTCGSTG
jgi:curli biogenesis system outer membrane secretion channel CsgG